MSATPTRDDPAIRLPAVAGRFYPASAQKLGEEVRGFLAAGAGSGPLISACAIMAPHAGYVYSGGVAGKVFARVRVPGRVILLCPNHTGLGKRISVYERGVFRVPGGDVPIDADLAAAILAEFRRATPDREAHRHEHAIEVELPFLQERQPGLAIVPIVLAGLTESDAIELGAAIHRACQRRGLEPGHDVLFVASSDMSHYLSDRDARRIDHVALEPLLAGDAGGLYRTVVDSDISMCGFIPATAMLSFARLAGAQPPELVGYATSGDAFGDRSRVVGYAGVIIPGAIDAGPHGAH